MWNVVKWIIKLLLALMFLTIHWTLFVMFIAFLFLLSWWKERRREAKTLGDEVEVGIVYREFDLYDLEGENEDGTDRREIYEKCYRGDEVTLKYNPSPEHENRLEVWTKFGQIGLIAPFFVEQHAEVFKSEEGARGRIKRIASGANPSCVLEIAFPAEQEEEEDEK